MKTNSSQPALNRRNFLSNTVLAGATYCLGCSFYLTKAEARYSTVPDSFEDHINRQAKMTYEQLFRFTYRDLILPQLVEIGNEMGREKLIEMLKKATDKVYSNPEFFKQYQANLPDQFWQNVLEIEVQEDSDRFRIYKITHCLWAKIFRESNAGDIGYALNCQGDYALAKINHEKLEREKTLMLGDEYCLLKWTKNV